MKDNLTILNTEIVEAVCIAGGYTFGIGLNLKKGDIKNAKKNLTGLKKALSRINRAHVKIKKLI